MTDQLLGWFALYGVPALFAILTISAIGVPFPGILLLIAAGSFVSQGQLSLWQVLVFGSAGAILGDQIGYGIGRWGGRALADRITDRIGGKQKLDRAHSLAEHWGGLAVFISRWLLTPLGPWVNISSGITEYPWHRFIFWDVIGEVLWVTIYVMVGRIFSGYVQEMADLLGTLTWILVGVAAAIILGWKVFQYFKTPGGQPTVNQNG